MKAKKTKLLISLIILLNLCIYTPSLSHMPRSDQLVYLASTADNTSFTSLVIKNYAYNRTNTEFVDTLDPHLFRPLIYIFLGLQKFLFGYNFMLWQLMGMLLHLGVVLCLLKVLLKHHNGFSAYILTLFFSFLWTTFEMVTWTNITGYMIFLICMLISLYHLQDVARDTSSSFDSKTNWKLFIGLMLATLTMELGIFYCLLMIIYVVFEKKLYKGVGVNDFFLIILLALPPLIFSIFNLIDFSYRIGDFLSVKKTFWNFNGGIDTLRSTVWWLFCGFFPTEINLIFTQRTVIIPLYIFDKYNFFSQLSILKLVPFALIGSYILLIKKTISKSFLKEKGLFLLLIAMMIASFTAVISFARMVADRDYIRILSDNTYYTYIFWVFLIIFIYYSIDFTKLQTLKIKSGLRTLIISLLCLLIIANAYFLNKNLVSRQGYDGPLAKIVTIIETLIKEEKHVGDFSFKLDDRIVSYTELDWIYKDGDNREKPGTYNYFELLYPQYYRDKEGKYIFDFDDTINGWIIRKGN